MRSRTFLAQNAKCAGCFGWFMTLSAASTKMASFCACVSFGTSAPYRRAAGDGKSCSCWLMTFDKVRVAAMPAWWATQWVSW